MLLVARDLRWRPLRDDPTAAVTRLGPHIDDPIRLRHDVEVMLDHHGRVAGLDEPVENLDQLLDVDRKSTRLNSSHGYISYAVFCLKKKRKPIHKCPITPGHDVVRRLRAHYDHN